LEAVARIPRNGTGADPRLRLALPNGLLVGDEPSAERYAAGWRTGLRQADPVITPGTTHCRQRRPFSDLFAHRARRAKRLECALRTPHADRICSVGRPRARAGNRVQALSDGECVVSFSDSASCAKAERARRNETLSPTQAGDTLVESKLDRLGEVPQGLVELTAELAAMNVSIRSIADRVDPRETSAQYVSHVFDILAEMRRDRLCERTTAALVAARHQGRLGDRKTALAPRRSAKARKLLPSVMALRRIVPVISVAAAELYGRLPGRKTEVICLRGSDHATNAIRLTTTSRDERKETPHFRGVWPRDAA